MESTPISEIQNLDSSDIKKILYLLRHNFLLILLAAILAGGAAFGISSYQTPIYEAKTQVMVTRSSSTGSVGDLTQALNAQQLGQTYQELLMQDWMREEVAAQIGSEVLEGQIKASAAANTMIINIAVQDPDPARAALIADTLVQVLISQNEKIQSARYKEAAGGLEAKIQQIQTQIAKTQTDLQLVKTVAVEDKLAQLQKRINAAQASMDTSNAELKLLEGMDPKKPLTVTSREKLLAQTRLELETQKAELQSLKNRLNYDTTLEGDEQARSELQARLAQVNTLIESNQSLVTRLDGELGILKTIQNQTDLESARQERQKNIALQQALLDSYQASYTENLTADEVKVNTEELSKLEKDLSLYQQVYLNFLNNLETVRMQEMQNVPNVIQVNPAVLNEEPVSPRILRDTILGILAGLILAVAGVLLADFLDATLKSKEDVERILQLPVIGYILKFSEADNALPGPFVLSNLRAPATEAFRSLRTNLEFIGVDHPLRSILVSSSGASEGKTTIVANLGAVMAQGGKRVLLLDADLRRPRLHKEMNLPNRLGLSDVFRERANLETVIQSVPGTSLSVITSGGIPPNPAELLASEKMKQILEQLESMFDFVIVDSTPTLVTDSQLIAARTDGVLFVMWIGRTVAEVARSTAEQYRRAGATPLGVVLNHIEPGKSYGGYGGYGGYYYYQYHYDSASKRRKGLGAIFSSKKGKPANLAD